MSRVHAGRGTWKLFFSSFLSTTENKSREEKSCSMACCLSRSAHNRQQAAHSVFYVCTHSLKSHGGPWSTSGLEVLHAGSYWTVSNSQVANRISSAWVMFLHSFIHVIQAMCPKSSQPLFLLPLLPCCEGFSAGVQDIHKSSIDTGLEN